jgi:hypothetical protein
VGDGEKASREDRSEPEFHVVLHSEPRAETESE